MPSLTRRTFLSKTAAAVAVANLHGPLTSSVWAQPTGANGDLRIAVAGLGNKGLHHIRNLREEKGVRLVAICDVDQVRVDAAHEDCKAHNESIKTFKDFRILLEDKDIDAVIIATPNHWHVLMTLWASQAGKDIYLEKPVNYDIWEGHRLMEIQKKYGKIIQGGTQNRSNPSMIEGVEYLRSGALGEIQWIHTVFYKFRRSMGRRRGPQRIPTTLDYDLFQGPAPMVPLTRNKLHYDWHWFWETGNGDMGNIGAHRVDNLRHVMGDDRQPNRVMSLGGRYLYDDDGQTPNVHLAWLDYGGIPAFSEIRNIPFKPGVTYMDHMRNARESCIVQCEGGYMLVGDGSSAYSNDGKRIQGFIGSGGGVKEHLTNFVDAVRNQDYSLLNCPVEYAVKAGELFHMANLSYRSGFPATFAEVSDVVGGIAPGENAVNKIRDNLDRHSVDLSKDQLTLGSWMSLEDSGKTLKVQNPDSDMVAQALFQKREYREPYAVPDQI